MRASTAAYPDLVGIRVVDAMHPGLISCSLESPLSTVARMMATYRVHAVLLVAHGDEALADGGVWGVVSDTDLLRAAEAADLDTQPARAIATTPALTIGAGEDLTRAAQLMSQENVSHLIVLEPHSGRPFGVLSTLDVARALAGFPERHPAPAGLG